MKKWELIQQDAKILFDKTKADVKRAINVDPSAAENLAEKVYGKLIDDLVLEVVSQYHRATVKGYANLVFPPHETTITNGNDHHVEKQFEEIHCPNCSQLSGPEKFPVHLMTCMNLRRTSSRLSTGRPTPVMKETSDPCPSTGTSDDGDYDDWRTPSTSQPKKKKMTQKSKNHKKV